MDTLKVGHVGHVESWFSVVGKVKMGKVKNGKGLDNNEKDLVDGTVVDDTVYDPPRVWTDLLRVTLLPLVHQGPHDGQAGVTVPPSQWSY